MHNVRTLGLTDDVELMICVISSIIYIVINTHISIHTSEGNVVENNHSDII